MFPINLRAHPPEFDEFPESWQEEMDIPDEVKAIEALSDGLDAYAAASAAILAAAEAVLNRGDSNDTPDDSRDSS